MKPKFVVRQEKAFFMEEDGLYFLKARGLFLPSYVLVRYNEGDFHFILSLSSKEIITSTPILPINTCLTGSNSAAEIERLMNMAKTELI